MAAAADGITTENACKANKVSRRGVAWRQRLWGRQHRARKPSGLPTLWFAGALLARLWEWECEKSRASSGGIWWVCSEEADGGRLLLHAARLFALSVQITGRVVKARHVAHVSAHNHTRRCRVPRLWS